MSNILVGGAGYIGNLNVADVVKFPFNTAATTGTPTTLSGSPVISAYAAGNTTEFTTGVTLTVDFDSRTGLNNVAVDTSSGYSAGDYNFVITAGNAGSPVVSVVGAVVGALSLGASRVADVRFWLGTAPATPGTNGIPKVDVNLWLGGAIPAVSSTGVPKVDVTHFKGAASVGAAGYVGPDWGNVNAPASTVSLSGTTIGTVTLLNGLAANAVTASSIAADALGSSEIAADAVTEIAAGIAASVPLGQGRGGR